MIFELIKPNPSKEARIAYIIAAIFAITGTAIGIAFEEQLEVLSVVLYSTTLIIVIAVSFYRFFINKQYQKIGTIGFKPDHIEIETETNKENLAYNEIINIALYFNGYHAQPGLRLNMRDGSKNYLQIKIHNEIRECEIFIKNLTQKKLLFKKLEDINEKIDDIKIYLMADHKFEIPSPSIRYE